MLVKSENRNTSQIKAEAGFEWVHPTKNKSETKDTGNIDSKKKRAPAARYTKMHHAVGEEYVHPPKSYY